MISSRYDGSSSASTARFSSSRSAGGSEATALTVAYRSTTSAPDRRVERRERLLDERRERVAGERLERRGHLGARRGPAGAEVDLVEQRLRLGRERRLERVDHPVVAVAPPVVPEQRHSAAAAAARASSSATAAGTVEPVERVADEDGVREVVRQRHPLGRPGEHLDPGRAPGEDAAHLLVRLDGHDLGEAAREGAASACPEPAARSTTRESAPRPSASSARSQRTRARTPAARRRTRRRSGRS